ncbi:MAG: calcium-binding protein [Solirubrobacteraceae bacterium]
MRFPIRIALAAVILAATAGAAHASPHGTLVVRGSNAGDTLALRLQAGHPKTLEIDFNDDGIADRRINRKSVKRIRIKTFAGDDRVRIDEANGAFTNRIPTRIDSGRGDDALLGGRGNERFYAGPGNDTVDGGRGADKAHGGDGDDVLTGGPGRDALLGQAGDDVLIGGAGLDALGGGSGDNIVMQ